MELGFFAGILAMIAFSSAAVLQWLEIKSLQREKAQLERVNKGLLVALEVARQAWADQNNGEG
jgi:hypothetical protein